MLTNDAACSPSPAKENLGIKKTSRGKTLFQRLGPTPGLGGLGNGAFIRKQLKDFPSSPPGWTPALKALRFTVSGGSISLEGGTDFYYCS